MPEIKRKIAAWASLINKSYVKENIFTVAGHDLD